MPRPIFALIDCNNFFVSCERIFRPELNGRPVVVLSSNDGCAVARSTEAKHLGIPMGAPAFKYRELFAREQVRQFSANFELYGDISSRLTYLLTSVTPRLEVYSVDESFLDLSELKITDYREWAAALRRRIWREIGLPVSIGIAPTKTLAKLASERAKKDPELSGVLNFIDLPEWLTDPQLAATDIRDIWGVGWRLAPKLRAQNVHTALQLKQLPLKQAAQLMGVHGRTMVLELQGTSCLPLERRHKLRQSVMHGRLFGEDTADATVIEAAIASLTARATARLRREQLLARQAVLRIASNRHKPGYRRLTVPLAFTTPTADSGQISRALFSAFSQEAGAHQTWHRADILLYDLVPGGELQTDLLGMVDMSGLDRAQARLHAVDSLTARFGSHAISFAAEHLSRKWQPKRRLSSPRYTTRWNELPVARITDP